MKSVTVQVTTALKYQFNCDEGGDFLTDAVCPSLSTEFHLAVYTVLLLLKSDKM